MAFTIIITEEADRHFQSLSARDQRFLQMAISSELLHEPPRTTKAIKRLRPNPLAEFKLQAGTLRVLYNVEENEVVILVVGKEVGNRLIVEGKLYGHQDHPLDRLETNLRKTLNECADSGETVVVECRPATVGDSTARSTGG